MVTRSKTLSAVASFFPHTDPGDGGQNVRIRQRETGKGEGHGASWSTLHERVVVGATATAAGRRRLEHGRDGAGRAYQVAAAVRPARQLSRPRPGCRSAAAPPRVSTCPRPGRFASPCPARPSPARPCPARPQPRAATPPLRPAGHFPPRRWPCCATMAPPRRPVYTRGSYRTSASSSRRSGAGRGRATCRW